MSPNTPVEVSILVYDLLPPSKLGTFLNMVGVYHTSVKLALPLSELDTDPQPQEFAFGGHDNPRLTGVFSVLAGTAPSRMPGLRYYTELKLGKAFGPAWRREPRHGTKKESDASKKPRSLAETLRSGPSLVSLVRGRSNSSATKVDNEDESDDEGADDGTTYMSRDQRRAWRIIQDMKAAEEWRGTSYNLLRRNCNTFTQDLVYRLTGQHAPGWINRAAWVATSLPCIVPAGWVDDAEEAAPDAPPDGSLTPNIANAGEAVHGPVARAPSASEPMRSH
ncbi:hypothetical protein OIV83_000448 [Microbotryomycetes sp. JL201]|nr:hypothetical protein OIV83_000448 [Microbotryomycetes sp. JL201]